MDGNQAGALLGAKGKAVNVEGLTLYSRAVIHQLSGGHRAKSKVDVA
jgi:hypothetical protein